VEALHDLSAAHNLTGPAAYEGAPKARSLVIMGTGLHHAHDNVDQW
jgi:hypothetical protein